MAEDQRELYLQPTQGLPAWLGRFGTKFVLGALSMREQSLPLDKDFGDHRYFDRSRFIYPKVDANSWRLELVGGENERSLSLDELLSLPQSTNLSVQECAGNGNHVMGSAGLLGQAVWAGPLLKDVLDLMGGPGRKTHLVFQGMDGVRFLRKGYHFGLSVEECIKAPAILATHMNGEPLSRERGAPIRLIVPGIYSMCHVKWLKSIKLVDTPHRGIHNTLIYVNKERKNGKWVKVQPRQIGLKSIIHRCRGAEHGWELSGIAWGSSSDIAGVEVSTDGGASWKPAGFSTGELANTTTMRPEDRLHEWQEFSYLWTPKPGQYLVGSRAINVSGEVQPLEIPSHIRGHYDQCQVKWRKIAVPSPDSNQKE